MPKPKTIWGTYLHSINKNHERLLDRAYAELLDCLQACIIASNYTEFHHWLKQHVDSAAFSFVPELAGGNSDYRHINYLRNHYLIESFALIGDFPGLLKAERTLDQRGSSHIADHYGLYRRLVPDIVATGREIYYCVNRMWLVSTQREEVKKLVLEKFSEVVAEHSKSNRRTFIEEFASRHEAAVRAALQATGYGDLHLRSLLDMKKDLLRSIAETVPDAYQSYVLANDWAWLVSKFPNEQEAADCLEKNVTHLKVTLPLGQLFLPFLPNYSLFYEVWLRPGIRRRAKNHVADLYPDCCRNIAYLPFGTISKHADWPAGGVYLAAFMNDATRWLEEFAKPWKGRK